MLGYYFPLEILTHSDMTSTQAMLSVRRICEGWSATSLKRLLAARATVRDGSHVQLNERGNCRKTTFKNGTAEVPP